MLKIFKLKRVTMSLGESGKNTVYFHKRDDTTKGIEINPALLQLK